MKFDTVIIGGGLSGLVCGIQLTLHGQRCAIISSGQSALHFSSGSFDLLNVLPDGEKVESPIVSIGKLIDQASGHPYAKIGETEFARLASQAKTFFGAIGLPLHGSAQKNHYRITPMGMLKSTWLSMDHFAFCIQPDQLPWKKVAIFNVVGFLDFYPQFLASEFFKLGTESSVHWLNLSALEHLRRNPSELRATNITKVLDKHIEELGQMLKDRSEGSDVILFPACIGLDKSAVQRLKEIVAKPLYFVPTMPPSIAGIQAQQYLQNYFIKLGGVYMLGDSARVADVKSKRVERIYSFNHGDVSFTGKNFVLATGSYFSQGLIATPDKIYEPVFDLDVTYATNRTNWYDPAIFKSQDYQRYGVRTDASFRGILQGEVLTNLFVTGAILDGFNPVKEGSGAGVSILSALAVAGHILHNVSEA